MRFRVKVLVSHYRGVDDNIVVILIVRIFFFFGYMIETQFKFVEIKKVILIAHWILDWVEHTKLGPEPEEQLELGPPGATIFFLYLQVYFLLFNYRQDFSMRQDAWPTDNSLNFPPLATVPDAIATLAMSPWPMCKISCSWRLAPPSVPNFVP